jgi:uncharacterized protein (DUF983 family)
VPDYMNTPLDRRDRQPNLAPRVEVDKAENSPSLPHSGWAAILRAVCGRCPCCNEAKLFAQFLKPISHCPACGQDWTHQRADDFPAYVAIFISGHLMAPVLIALINGGHLTTITMFAVVLPLALLLVIGLLQPAKGIIIALQWWFGMHDFVKERADVELADGDN